MRLYSWLDQFASRLRWVNRLRAARPRRARAKRRQAPLSFERLEDRVLLAAPNPFGLSSLDGLVGFTLDGVALNDSAGFSVRSAGDINNDGFDDLIIGAPDALANAGQVFVVFGKDDWSTTPVIDLNALDGTNGFRIDGQGPGLNTGLIATGIGDFNGDGIHDIAISQPTAAPGGTAQAGRIYVIWGAANIGAGGVFDLAPLDNATTTDTFGGIGIRIQGSQTGARAGYSISNVGDIDGDGYNDLVIGAPRHDMVADNPNNLLLHGQAYIVFGKFVGGNNQGGWFDQALVNLNALGGDGLTFNVSNTGSPPGGESQDRLGFTVAGIGDVNGDGRADLLFAAPYAEDTIDDTNSGKMYVVFGNERGSIATSTGALNGTNGFSLKGVIGLDYAGWKASGLGDINGDGFDDFIVSAPYADPSGKASAGTAYVIFGRSNFVPILVNSQLNLNTLDGFRGFRIHGENAGDYAGWSVGGGGDVDGDGFDDILIGAPGYNGGAGRTYVIFGKKAPFDATMLLADLNGTTGFKIDGIAAGGQSGHSVANAGDVNGDGFDDIIIGAPGAYAPTPQVYAGQVYVVFGGNFRPLPGTQVGTSDSVTPETLDANTNPANRDNLIGGLGPDTLISDGGPDVLRGGQGDDFIHIVDTNFFIPTSGINGNANATRRINGGLGRDTLVLATTNTTLDLTQIPDNRIQEIEVIDIRSGSNTLVVTPLEVRNLSTTGNTLTVRRRIGDLVTGPGGAALESSGWNRQYDTVDNNPASSTFGVTFRVYTAGQGVGAARLLVEDPAVLNFLQVDGYDPATGGTTGGQPNGHPGVTFFGQFAGDFSGISVAGVGDVNGDGFDDFLIGAYGSDVSGNQSGAVFLIFGKAGPWNSTFDLADTIVNVNGVNAVKLAGIDADDLAGFSVSGLGDVNGDGFADFVIGAYRADRDTATNSSDGEAYIVYGKADWSATPVFNIATLDGTNGYIFRGEKANDFAGWSVSLAGDVNGDGFADLLVGAPQADPGAAHAADNSVDGSTYVVFGGPTLLAALDAADGLVDGKIDLHRVNGLTGFRIDGANRNDRSGSAVSAAGDVNGDGFADILIGAFGADSDPVNNITTDEGAAYVVFGKANWSATPVLNLASLNGVNGVRFNGENIGDWAGFAVSSAGDVNGDGFDDIIIGAYYHDPLGRLNAGRAYVVFGQADWSAAGAAGIDLGSLNGTNGFIINGMRALDLAGWSVTGIGDFNGDGFDDIVVGARRARAHNNGVGSTAGTGQLPDTGQGYLIFGKADWTATPLFDPAASNFTFIDSLNGIRLDGIGSFDFTTNAIRKAGDVNGDGFDDFLVAAYNDSPLGRNQAGTTYLVFGGSFLGTAQPIVGLDGNDTLNAVGGNAVRDLLIGGQGNNVFNPDGGGDVMRGGAGNDLFRLFDVNFADGRRIDGGNGIDTIRLEGLTGVTFDLTTLTHGQVRNIDVIDITGIGHNTLKVSLQNVLNMAAYGRDPILGQGAGGSISNTLTVLRDRGDIVDMGAGWTTAAVAEWDPNLNAFFVVYEQGAARLRVQDVYFTFIGSTAQVIGTAQDDSFIYNSVTGVMTVNGVAFDLNLAGAFNFIQIDGRVGTDSFLGIGGPGNDLLQISNNGVNFEFNAGHPGFDLVGVSIELATLQGGGGTDTIQLTGAGQLLNLTTPFGSQTQGVEFIDLTGTGNNTLNINPTAFLNNNTNPLTVLRNNNDVVNVQGPGWVKSPNAALIGGSFFEIYTHSGLQLRVQSPAISFSGSTAVVNGTNGNDIFVYDAVTNVITINGTNHQLPGTIDYVYLDGQGGFDQLTLLGTPNNDRAVFTPTAVNFEFNSLHAGFDFTGVNIEKFIFDGRGQTGGVGDQAVFNGSTGSNTFTANPFSASMKGGGVDYFAVNVEQIVATGGGGGTNIAQFFDSAGNDVFSVSPTVANMSGPGFFNQAQGFQTVSSRAINGGFDTAFLQGTGNNVTFSGDAAALTASISGAGFFNTVEQYETAVGQVFSPTNNTAYLFDSAGNDTLVSHRTVSFLQTPGGHRYQAEGFGTVSARKVAGGFDQAFLYDNPGNDVFTGNRQRAWINPAVPNGGVGNHREAVGFDIAAGRSVNGGRDAAVLFDTPVKNVLSANPDVVNLSRPAGLYLQAQGFKDITVHATTGGDQAFLTGSAGNDVFTAGPNSASLVGPGATPAYTIQVFGFASVSARTGGGNDIANLNGSAGNDTFNANAVTGVASLQGTGFYSEAIGFGQVFAVGNGGSDTANLIDSPANDLFFARQSTGHLSGPGYFYQVQNFGTVNIFGITGGVNTADVQNLLFTLNPISSWVFI